MCPNNATSTKSARGTARREKWASRFNCWEYCVECRFIALEIRPAEADVEKRNQLDIE